MLSEEIAAKQEIASKTEEEIDKVKSSENITKLITIVNDDYNYIHCRKIFEFLL